MLSYLPGFEPDLDDWTNDDYETPTDEARKIADLIRDDEWDILDPCAGTGQLIRPIELLNDRLITAIELKPSRVKAGTERCHWATWIQGNFLLHRAEEKFDLVVANPPFSLRMEFVHASLQVLKPSGRLLFLMPIDFNCGRSMGDRWKKLDCHIHHEYVIQHRVAYLNANGIPQKGRQIYDAVFDIRPGKGGGRTFL